jgi:hypothetical protein
MWGPRSKLVALAGCLLSLTAACDSQRRYAGLAHLGSLYADALDRLLVAASDISVDATSERLLQDRQLSLVDSASYRKLSDIDVERLKILNGLRGHAQLMGRYFAALNDLASSDAPRRAGAATDGTIDNLNALGQQLRGSNLIPAKSVFTSLTKIVVGGAIRGALRDELSRRGETIRIELKTQEELLRALAADVKHDLTITKAIREQRLVIDPLVSPNPIANPDAWIANRRAVLNLTSSADELATASTAVGKLREAFESLMSGRLDADRISGLEGDFQALLALAETVKKQI